ncbi:MAG: cytochrome c [Flavobacteriales bacterium]
MRQLLRLGMCVLCASGSLVLLSSVQERKAQPTKDDKVAGQLIGLGMEKPAHYIENATPELIKRGEELIFLGKTTPPEGESSNHISKFYKCVSCHNTVKEDPDLTVINQQARLDYAVQNDLPYLQGSTFYGIVNRESWYNDDYVKKYGSLVENAKNSLQGSVQLCAEVCAQGRTLKDWEMESILAYFWSIGLKKSDLTWNKEEYESWGSSTDEEKIELIKSKYLQTSPATFSSVPKDKAAGYSGITGNADNGKHIYELGCQHCHREQGESDVVLDNAKPTFRWLERNITANTKLSIYEIIRKGTYSEKGHQEYMPHYTLEKMSHQQVEDLRAYIEVMAD